MISIGQKFPSFQLTAVQGTNPDNAFKQVSEKTFADKWKVYFFWPKDFTFICPTEIREFNNLADEFESRKTAIIGCSTDSEFVHLAWQEHSKELKNMKFPWLSDIKRELSEELGIIDRDAGVCQRATFIVDPTDVVRFISVNDLSIGRNVNEVLRVLDALQTGKPCPCNWQP